jgi:hypothetical protein
MFLVTSSSTKMETVNLGLATVVFVAFAATPVACNGPTSPTAGGTPVLAIEPTLSAMKVGQTAPLRAVQRLPDGTQRSAVAAWTSDAPTVIAADSNGVLSARTTGSASILASADGLTASLRLESVPDASGDWSGQTLHLEHVRVSGAGPFRPATGATRPISFTLQQDGASLSGSGIVDLTPGSMEGTIRSDGRITLKGTFENSEGFHAEITESLTDLDGTGQAVTGQFTIREWFVNAWGRQEILSKRQILSLTRQQ